MHEKQYYAETAHSLKFKWTNSLDSKKVKNMKNKDHQYSVGAKKIEVRGVHRCLLNQIVSDGKHVGSSQTWLAWENGEQMPGWINHQLDATAPKMACSGWPE